MDEFADADREAIWDEILEFTVPPGLADDEFTARGLQKQALERGTKMSYAQIRSRLDTAVRSGKMTKRDVLHNGHWCNAYRMVRDK